MTEDNAKATMEQLLAEVPELKRLHDELTGEKPIASTEYAVVLEYDGEQVPILIPTKSFGLASYFYESNRDRIAETGSPLTVYLVKQTVDRWIDPAKPFTVTVETIARYPELAATGGADGTG